LEKRTARAGRFQPLREHLTSSHEKSPLIACPNRGRRLRRKAAIVDALKPWLAETWPDQPETKLAEASPIALSMGMAGLFVGAAH